MKAILSPYQGISRVEPIEPLVPIVLLARKAADKIRKFLALSAGKKREVSFVGKVELSESNGSPRYLIKEIVMPEIISSSAKTVINALSLAKIVHNWMKKDRERNPLKFWGHTHLGCGTGPSSIDNLQMMDLIQGQLTPDYFIRGIFNVLPGQPAEADFTVFDYKRGVQFKHVPWRTVAERRKKWLTFRYLI